MRGDGVVLVTGGAGFIGSNLVARLVTDPGVRQITVVDDCSTGCTALLGSDLAHVDFRLGTVLDSALLDDAVGGSDVIVHLAAVPSVPRSVADPLRSHEANATGTLYVLEAARRAGGPMVIAASSSSVYGAQPIIPKREDSRPMPLSPYAVTKLAAEAYLGAYHSCFDLPVLPLRFFNVYGPRQCAGHPYAAVVPTFLDAAMRGRPLVVHGDGSQTRDLTHVDTVCDVIMDALHRRVVSLWPVNLALGTRTSLLELIDLIGGLLGRRPDTVHVDPRPGDVPHSQADPSRLLALFPETRPKPLRAGLADTLAWHRAQQIGPEGNAALQPPAVTTALGAVR
ncbi:MAG: UDP-glucose 4-epimerase [Actinomycetota bacterium]|nr:UDP-glucose 4-epimerase [Actinomycetota bacterium]